MKRYNILNETKLDNDIKGDYERGYISILDHPENKLYNECYFLNESLFKKSNKNIEKKNQKPLFDVNDYDMCSNEKEFKKFLIDYKIRDRQEELVLTDKAKELYSSKRLTQFANLGNGDIFLYGIDNSIYVWNHSTKEIEFECKDFETFRKKYIHQ